MKFNGYDFVDIKKFDGRIINLINQAGGELFTVLPVSGKPNVIKRTMKYFTEFTIIDDWSNRHKIRIPNRLLHKISIPE